MKLKFDTKRESVVFWMPALVLFAYLITTSWQDEIFIIRLIYSIFFAFLLQFIGLMAYFISISIIEYISGSDVAKSFENIPSKLLISAVLLASFVWIMWQYNVDKRVDDLKQCMDDYEYDATEFSKPSEFLEWCNDNLSEQDDTYE